MELDPKIYLELVNAFEGELNEGHEELVSTLLKLEKLKNKRSLDSHIETVFRVSHNIKGAAKSIAADSIAAIAHELEDTFCAWRENKYLPKKNEIESCLKKSDEMLVCFKSIKNELKKKSGSSDGGFSTSAQTLKIPLSRVEKANAYTNEFVTYQLKFENCIKRVTDSLGKIKQQAASNILFDEIIYELDSITNDGTQFIGEFTRNLQSLQTELQSMRLIPIAYLLTPLSRTVRDLSLSMNKSVNLHVTGEGIELDKLILDELKDPLLHLIRNALDHGIESDETRKKLKKPIPANLSIAVSHQASRIQIVVSDDGAGIDIDKLWDKAIKQANSLKSKS